MQMTSRSSNRNRRWMKTVFTAVAVSAAACGGSSSGSQFDVGSTGSTAAGQGGASTTGTPATGTSTGVGGSIGTIGSGGSPVGDGGLGDAPSNGAPDGCGQSSIQASSKVVNVLLVIDKSGSMTTTPTGFATDKWTAMKTALSSQ